MTAVSTKIGDREANCQQITTYPIKQFYGAQYFIIRLHSANNRIFDFRKLGIFCLEDLQHAYQLCKIWDTVKSLGKP
jgi:hypothetical protein